MDYLGERDEREEIGGGEGASVQSALLAGRKEDSIQRERCGDEHYGALGSGEEWIESPRNAGGLDEGVRGVLRSMEQGWEVVHLPGDAELADNDHNVVGSAGERWLTEAADGWTDVVWQSVACRRWRQDLGPGCETHGGGGEVRRRAPGFHEGAFRDFGDGPGFLTGRKVGELCSDSRRNAMEEPVGWERADATDVCARASGAAALGSGQQADCVREHQDGAGITDHADRRGGRQGDSGVRGE